MKKVKFKIYGMHCKSCVSLIENELKEAKGVKFIKVDLDKEECKLKFDENKISIDEIQAKIKELGYTLKKKPNLKQEKEFKKKSYKSYVIAGIFLLIFAAGYMIINKTGSLEIMSKLNSKELGLGLIFFIGFLASFHCVGMCGGLVAAYSASCSSNCSKSNCSKKGEINKSSFFPHLSYNISRLSSYMLVGLILGGIGSFFAVSPTAGTIIMFIAGILMILMGLSLFTNFGFLKKLESFLPSKVADILYSNKNSKNPKSPWIIGFLSGFMPCGPLQAMQLYALSTGSYTEGALAMGAYALGTIPLMFGFGSVISLISQKQVAKVMKFSGVVVIILGVIMINRGFQNSKNAVLEKSAQKALANSVENTEQKEEKDNLNTIEYDSEGRQVVNMAISYNGYDPNTIYIKKGVPVKWVINGEGVTRCTDEIVLYLPSGEEKRKKINNGDIVTINFTPEEVGEIRFSCWMKMVWGKFIVTEDGEMPAGVDKEENSKVDSRNDTNTRPSTCGGACGTSNCGCGSSGAGGCGCGGSGPAGPSRNTNNNPPTPSCH